jgi:drug/metabolite transporter (DMT)-like permease
MYRDQAVDRRDRKYVRRRGGKPLRWCSRGLARTGLNVSESTKKADANRTREVLGLLGFLLVATAQVSNMILARGVAGSVPPFSIAFFRWSIVTLGLLPAVVMALRQIAAWCARTVSASRWPAFSACSSAAAGALFSLPFAIHEIWSTPSAALSGRAALVYLFAGLVPGLFAYSAYAYLGSMFGAVSTSFSLYLGPIVSAVLSIIFLGEAPTTIHLVGGALSLGSMWLCLHTRKSRSR